MEALMTLNEHDIDVVIAKLKQACTQQLMLVNAVCDDGEPVPSDLVVPSDPVLDALLFLQQMRAMDVVSHPSS
jgi:hypothetical protein